MSLQVKTNILLLDLRQLIKGEERAIHLTFHRRTRQINGLRIRLHQNIVVMVNWLGEICASWAGVSYNLSTFRLYLIWACINILEADLFKDYRLMLKCSLVIVFSHSICRIKDDWFNTCSGTGFCLRLVILATVCLFQVSDYEPWLNDCR